MQWFVDIFNQFRALYTDWVEFFLDTKETRTNVRSIVFLVWAISFIIILPLHLYSLKKVLQSKQNLTNSVDEVIYLLSKAQYSLSETQPLKYDPCFALMKTMFWSWHFEYIDNLDTIKENVKKVEILLKQRVISDEQWDKINSQKNSLEFHTFWSKLFGYELNIVTLWIYYLFW